MRHLLPFVGGHDVVRREVLLDVDAQTSPVLLLDLLGDLRCRLGKITNMSVARLNPVLVAEEAAENLGLGWRFDDDERFGSHYECAGAVPKRDTSTFMTDGRNVHLRPA